MHQSIINFNNIQSSIKSNQEQTNNKNNIKIIAVSKTFEISHINPLIDYGHTDFGENKVQEAIEKWTDNAVTNRARIAKDEIIAKLITHCNANSIALATGEDAQVTQAFDLKVVKTVKERQEEAEKLLPK